MKRHDRAIALISTLMFIGVLFMMAVAMIGLSRQRLTSGVSQFHQAQALYLAEAGLAKSQVALEANVNWPGVTDATIDEMAGTYTVKFGTGKYDSVNNIENDFPAASYRGPATVPPKSALLIVEANVNGRRYVLEALVEGTGGTGPMSDAILASGKITSKGDLTVDGIAALDDSSPVDGSIQSNEPGTADLVTWEGGGTALITGNVGTMGSTSAAINMPGANILGGPDLNSFANIPATDITTEVTNNLGHPAPVFVTAGISTLAGGNYTISGNQTVNGDVVLEDGATLYVNGDLTINGSITGTGKVYVNGNTTFKGDSAIITSKDYSVSLYSKGDVSLTGFDGSQYLADLASTDGNLQTLLTKSEVALTDLKANYNVPWGPGGPHPRKDQLDIANARLGRHQWEPAPGEGRLFFQIKDNLDDRQSSPSLDFLVDRFGTLDETFSSAETLGIPNDQQGALDNFEGDGSMAAIVDAVLNDGDPSLNPATAYLRWPPMMALIEETNYDQLGTSYFQGAIYTNGHFYADNEITIRGALIVDGNGSNPQTINLPGGGTVQLKSGDIYLGNRTHVTFVEEMFEDSGGSSTGAQLLTKKLWMGR